MKYQSILDDITGEYFPVGTPDEEGIVFQGRNLNLSFIGRNLFFIYKDAPVDPDVSLSTGNGMGAFEAFNMPSSRSYGFSLKLNL